MFVAFSCLLLFEEYPVQVNIFSRRGHWILKADVCDFAVKWLSTSTQKLNLRFCSVIISENDANTPAKARAQGKQVLFINNAIHPGEPCGIDASMMLVRDYLTNENLKENLYSICAVVLIQFL